MRATVCVWTSVLAIFASFVAGMVTISPVSAEERVVIECVDDSSGQVTAVFFDEGGKCPNGTTANVTEDTDGKYDSYFYDRPDNVGDGTNASCEEIVRRLEGPHELLGGDQDSWMAPDHANGAWVYLAVDTAEMEWPGFGWFDVPGVRFITDDVVGNDLSFHCEEPPQGYPAGGNDDARDADTDDGDSDEPAGDETEYSTTLIEGWVDGDVSCKLNGNGDYKCTATSDVTVTVPSNQIAFDLWPNYAPPPGMRS